jgi:predicted Zn-dependent peptidase
LGRPILGAAETVAGVSVDDLRAFRDKHTTGARVVISVAGGYDRKQMIDLAQKRFGALKPSRETKATKAKAGSAILFETRKSEQAHLVLSCGGVAQGADEAPAHWIFSELLGGGMASRLFQEVREKRGLVYGINSWLESYEDVGRLGVYAACSAKHAKEVALCVIEALDAFASEGPTDQELSRAKAIVSAQMLMGAEAPSARCESRANQVFLRGRIMAYSEVKEKLLAVSADDVRVAAKRALKGPRAGAVIGPKAGQNALSAFVEAV